MWWHTQQNNKRLGGQIYHTRYIVLLYRTCPYIVPYAAISCLVLPNCHPCAAIECKSSHKIFPYVAISPSVCYIVSGVPRYANNHATTSGMHYIVPYAAISYAVKIKGLTGQRLSLKRRETALCRNTRLTVVCETKWSETKRNETKWKSVVCEMRICSLRNENL